jgi:hypothetical protein
VITEGLEYIAPAQENPGTMGSQKSQPKSLSPGELATRTERAGMPKELRALRGHPVSPAERRRVTGGGCAARVLGAQISTRVFCSRKFYSRIFFSRATESANGGAALLEFSRIF